MKWGRARLITCLRTRSTTSLQARSHYDSTQQTCDLVTWRLDLVTTRHVTIRNVPPASHALLKEYMPEETHGFQIKDHPAYNILSPIVHEFLPERLEHSFTDGDILSDSFIHSINLLVWSGNVSGQLSGDYLWMARLIPDRADY